jgi:hypothetical protein
MRGRKGRQACLILGLTLLLCACGHRHQLDTDTGSDDELNAYPSNYKSDILAAMHSYLNDPTGIRDAAISQPALKSSGYVTRYMVCVQFNPKKNASEYAGIKEAVAVFLVGRFDHFVDTLHDECTGVTYAPFPELQKLSP